MTAVDPQMPDEAALALISGLDVSDGWKERFAAIARAGGPKLPRMKQLSPAERGQAMRFNVLAFFFGPFYYMAKGMWRRSISMFGLSIAVVLLLEFVLGLAGIKDNNTSLGVAVGVIYAIRANLDYYKKAVLKDNGWW